MKMSYNKLWKLLIDKDMTRSYYLRALILPELILTLLFFILLYKPIIFVNKKLRIEDNKRGRRVVR